MCVQMGSETTWVRNDLGPKRPKPGGEMTDGDETSKKNGAETTRAETSWVRNDCTPPC